MGASPLDSRRSLVPRWRYTSRTPFTAEHEGDPSREIAFTGASPALNFALEDWRREPSVAHAVEVISCACSFGKPEVAHEAAQFLNRSRNRLPETLGAATDWILSGSHHRNDRVPTSSVSPDASRTEAQKVIGHARSRLRDAPRNPKHWLDLALAYAVLGHTKRAERAMQTARALAPNHRIVLRTQARMLVHMDRVDEAHALIRRHPRTAGDPWLMSTEISLATMLGNGSVFAARGRRFALDYGYGPAHITELAGATANLESAAGAHRRARKLYDLALIQPTDNVVAHIQYLSQRDRSLSVPRDQLAVPHAMEARAWRAWMDARWQDALAEAIAWQLDEPFSSRPATTSSCIAVGILGNAELAILCAVEGLRCNEGDQLLRNNLVVALARAGRFQDASREFRKIREPLQAGYALPVYQATQGLMAFAGGDYAAGRQLYTSATQSNDPQLRALAAIHWLETEWIFFPDARARIAQQLAVTLPRIVEPATRAIAQRVIARTKAEPAEARTPHVDSPLPQARPGESGVAASFRTSSIVDGLPEATPHLTHSETKR